VSHATHIDSELADACTLVPRILADEAQSLPRSTARSLVAAARLTDTRTTIVTLGTVGEPPCAVIKMPMTVEGAHAFAWEGDALVALHADERLGDWRRLVPRPLAAGSVLGQPYRVDSFIGGHALVERFVDPAVRGVLMEAAAATIHNLHQATASTVTGGADVAEQWIDARLADLSRSGADRHPRFLSRAARLRAELYDAIGGRTLTTSWIHGDYWPGNLLFSPGCSEVSGIVDWDAADPADLPMHDVMQLVLYTRRLCSGQALGQIVRGQLRHPSLSPTERRILDRYAGWLPDGWPSYRHAVLLYWLRHVALHARQHSCSADWRYRRWETTNVHAVLEAL
jgi:aminoglycoside phosphotransferase (APT) family kinase protein